MISLGLLQGFLPLPIRNYCPRVFVELFRLGKSHLAQTQHSRIVFTNLGFIVWMSPPHGCFSMGSYWQAPSGPLSLLAAGCLSAITDVCVTFWYNNFTFLSKTTLPIKTSLFMSEPSRFGIVSNLYTTKCRNKLDACIVQGQISQVRYRNPNLGVLKAGSMFSTTPTAPRCSAKPKNEKFR